MSKQVVITGANGWIGGRLARHLHAAGWYVTGISRTPEEARAKTPGIDWLGLDEAFDEAVRDAGTVVNLAGRHLLERPWDEDFRTAMYESRIGVTKRVVKALAESSVDGKTLISASGYPVYGDTGDTEASETHPVSRETFLYELDADWEDAARAAEPSGTRVALIRIGLVFGRDGGAFPVLKQPFDQGMGIVLGSGEQWIPWIHIEDLVALLVLALEDRRCNGPINAVAPNPIRHKDFAQALAGALGKPCKVTVPEPQVRDSMGGAAQLVLMSSRLIPERATGLGFAFRYPDLGTALPSLTA